MKMNRIQLQPRMSLTQFLAHYGTESQCEAVVEKSRWPSSFVCPRCGAKQPTIYQRNRVKVFQCRACRTQTTLKGRFFTQQSSL